MLLWPCRQDEQASIRCELIPSRQISAQQAVPCDGDLHVMRQKVAKLIQIVDVKGRLVSPVDVFIRETRSRIHELDRHVAILCVDEHSRGLWLSSCFSISPGRF